MGMVVRAVARSLSSMSLTSLSSSLLPSSPSSPSLAADAGFGGFVHVCHWCLSNPQLEQCLFFLPGVVVVVVMVILVFVVVGLLAHVLLEWRPLPQMVQWYGRVSCERFFECRRCVFCGGMA